MRRRVLITGGGRRVGLATARALAPTCDLVITTHSDVEAVRRTTGSLPTTVDVVPLDLGDPDDVESFEIDGPIDGIVHNASIYGPTPLEEVDETVFMRYMRVNALAPLLLTKRLVPKLRASSAGSIVVMADIHTMGLPRVAFSAYSMSKAALVEFVRVMARELVPIRVNGVAPGVVAWPEEGYESDQESQEAYLRLVPLERPGTPEEAAEAVRWLLLDATYTTGQFIRVDGGRALR
ncbi:MAG: SDR family oxidoreductase [Phycisphaerales bacterium]|nr:SDR family oxidoreductase [Phycisphaerales bacterium]